jgi:hypothetical protein
MRLVHRIAPSSSPSGNLCLRLRLDLYLLPHPRKRPLRNKSLCRRRTTHCILQHINGIAQISQLHKHLALLQPSLRTTWIQLNRVVGVLEGKIEPRRSRHHMRERATEQELYVLGRELQCRVVHDHSAIVVVLRGELVAVGAEGFACLLRRGDGWVGDGWVGEGRDGG